MRPDAHALVAAYAVDALDEAERADVRAHLDECSVCRDDLRGYRETTAVLASVTAEPPPARMRSSVLARIRDTPQLPPLTPSEQVAASSPAGRPVPDGPDSPDGPDGPGGPNGSGGPDGSGAPEDDPTGRVPGQVPGVPAARTRRDADGGAAPARRGVSPVLFGLAASTLTVVALGAGAWGLSASGELSDVRAQQAAVQRVLAADDVVSVGATPQLGGGVQGDEVVVLASASADAALLLPAGLPAAPQGSTWQAWVVTGDEAVSAGVFDVRGGEAVALGAGVDGVDAVAVSLEPDGGSQAPTTDPVLVVPLA